MGGSPNQRECAIISVSIRSFGSADRDCIASILSETGVLVGAGVARDEEHAATIPRRNPLSLERAFRAAVAAGAFRAYSVLAGDHVVGLITATDVARSQIVQLGVTISTQAARRGIGAASLTQMLIQERRLGSHTIRVTVRIDNIAAVGLYRKLGFRRTATVAMPLGPDNDSINAHVFELDLETFVRNQL